MTDRALIVDDEEDIGRLMSRFLLKEDINSEYVTRIEIAREIINKGNHTIFFLDLNLPDGSGYDLIPQIHEVVPNPYIVVISAYDGDDEMERLSECKINAFVKKPFSKKEIINSLSSPSK